MFKPLLLILLLVKIHDIAYDQARVKGAIGLLTSTQVIRDDWKFVAQELALSRDLRLDQVSRLQATILGYGLGLAALPKTGLYFLYVGGKAGVNALGQGASNIKH